MESMTLRSALQYLWDHHYTVQSIASAFWEIIPPQTGIWVDLPPIICSPPMVTDLALLHQMVLSQAIAVDLEHQLHRQPAHAIMVFERLRWIVRPAGNDRWQVQSAAVRDRGHPLNGHVIGVRRLWGGAMEIERAAILDGIAHLQRYGQTSLDAAGMTISFLDG